MKAVSALIEKIKNPQKEISSLISKSMKKIEIFTEGRRINTYS